MNPFTIIKSHVSIRDVINTYTTLKQAGVYWKGICPFHSEKTPSFTVSPHKEIFYCFGCHVGGDVITFVSKIENCSPIEAAKHLADQYGVELPQAIKTEVSQTKNRYAQLCEKVAQWCHQKLLKYPAGLSYLKKRGINKDSIVYFEIGYFPAGMQEVKFFIQAMANQNILVEDLLEANILSQGKTTFYSPFEDRIIFSIKDHLGRFCGFGGRVFKPQDNRAKYYNSKENEYFSKGSLLFGLDLAKNTIQTTKKVFLVEGYIDCIAMVQHGFTNSIASLGTACTPMHLKYLSRYAQHAYVLYDGDFAGTQALLRLAQVCWQASIELHVIPLPAQEDPASLLEKGLDIGIYISRAQDLFTFFVKTLSDGFLQKSLQEKLELTRIILRTIGQITDRLTRNILLGQAAAALSLPIEVLENELKDEAKTTVVRTSEVLPTVFSGQERKHEPVLSDTSALCHVSLVERKLFCAIMNNIDLFIKHPDQDYMIHQFSPPLGVILQRLKSMHNQHAQLTFTVFFDTLEDDKQHMLSMVCLEFDDIIDSASFEQLLQQLKRNSWKQSIKSIKLELELAQKNEDRDGISNVLKKFEILKTMLQSRKLNLQ
jgi:DNA primase catalytic core